MKRWIHAFEEVGQDGFFFVIRNKGIFLRSNSKNLTKKILRDLINTVCDMNSVGDKIRESALYSEATLEDFRRRTQRAVLKKVDTGKVEYYSIRTPNGTSNYPIEDFKDQISVVDARE